MSTQPPVRYENYPPDDSATPAGSTDEHTPVVRAYVPATIPPTSDGSSRRTLIGWVIAVPILGIVGAIAMNSRSNGTGRDGSGDGYSDDTGYSADTDDPEATEEFSVGDYSSTAPAGWTVFDDGSGKVEVSNGTNRLTAVSLETATSGLAVDEIAQLAKSHFEGFTGRLGDPVDRSSQDVQHATMEGTGKFQGVAARLLAELWIDDSGSGLFVVRVLTAKASSTVDVQAREMVNELSGEF